MGIRYNLPMNLKSSFMTTNVSNTALVIARKSFNFDTYIRREVSIEGVVGTKRWKGRNCRTDSK